MSTREIVLAFIHATPGAYFRQIAAVLGLGNGTLDYALTRLQKEGEVTCSLVLGKRCYFSPAFSAEERRLLGCLRDTTSTRIITLLIESPRRHGELCRTLTLSKSSVSWHLERLAREQVLVRKGQEFHLRHPALAEALLTNYRQNLLDRLASNFSDLWQ